MSDEQIIAKHLDWLRRITESAKTLRGRKGALRRLAAVLPVPLLDASAADLDLWQSNLTVGRSAVATYTSHVYAFYTWLQLTGQRTDNPAERLPRPKIRARLPRPIPEKHLRLAFRAARGDMIVWLALAGWVGLRAGEIAALHGDDVVEDTEGMWLHIRGKGGKQRVVPVPADVAPLVRAARRRGQLFRRPRGGRVDGDYISGAAGAYLHTLGLPYTLHQLRHRFGTEFYRISGDIRQTQELLGHATLATTALYTAVARRAARRPLNRLGKTLPHLALGPPDPKGT